MNAAIYARKSTEQNGVAEEAKSVTRQVENAKAFALKMGWSVADAHVFVDDGISGAEFEARPGLQRLLAMAETRKPPFQRLVVSEQKSIGREMAETGYTIKRLAEAGIEIFEYVHGKSLTPRRAIDKIMSNVQGFADEAHREATSERVHEAHARLHKAGHCVGGRIFGYKNRTIYKGEDAHGRPLKTHVERVIDPDEAAVVRRIFELYDSGYGLKRIAKMLTDEGSASVKYRRNDGLEKVEGWATSTVRAALRREMYHGAVVWNKTRKKNDYGKLDVTDRPESEWIRTPAESLRIIDEDLWKRVQTRRDETEKKAVRFESGYLSGRPPKDAVINLLAGIATCGECGGGIVVDQSNNRKGRYKYYICHRRRMHGRCSNMLRIPAPEMNEAVLQAIEEHALTPEAIEQVVLLSEREDAADQRMTLERERAEVEKKIARVTAAIESGGELASLVARVRELEARRGEIDEALRNLRPIPRLAPAVIDSRLAEWRRLLRSSTTQAHTVLQRVLRGRIVFTPRPDGAGYDFSAPTRFDKLFTGIVIGPPDRPSFIDDTDQSGKGGIGPEDTGELDYERLLEGARRSRERDKGWCAQHDSNVRPPGS